MDDEDERWPQKAEADPQRDLDVVPILLTVYLLGAVVVGFITFVGAWGWCIYTYGFMIGVGFGWFPSLITGVIVGALWPLLTCLGVIFWVHLGEPGAGEVWEALRRMLL